MKIKAVIMAHPKRVHHAGALARKVQSQGMSCSITWDKENDEWDTGKRSLLEGVDVDWLIVLQDDAIIGDNFVDNVLTAISSVPHPTLISLYTGTTRPFSRRVTNAVEKAKAEKASWIQFDRLCWGVGIVIKSAHIKPLLEKVQRSNLPYDERIGSFFHFAHMPVYYINPSIVDHRDEQSLVKAKHDYKRVAHVFSDELLELNNIVVKM